MNMKTKILLIALALGLSFSNARAQDDAITENPAEVNDGNSKTMDELVAERAALVALSKSEEFLEKLAKADKLKAPKETGVAGVDALTEVLTPMVEELRKNRDLIPQFYASVTKQTIDGAAATDVKPVSPDQMMALSKMFVQMGVSLVKSSKDLVSLPGEIKSAGPMKILKSVKSVAYIKDAIGVVKQELTYNSKMLGNLIATNRLENGSN